MVRQGTGSKLAMMPTCLLASAQTDIHSLLLPLCPHINPLTVTLVRSGHPPLSLSLSPSPSLTWCAYFAPPPLPTPLTSLFLAKKNKCKKVKQRGKLPSTWPLLSVVPSPFPWPARLPALPPAVCCCLLLPTGRQEIQALLSLHPLLLPVRQRRHRKKWRHREMKLS